MGCLPNCVNVLTLKANDDDSCMFLARVDFLKRSREIRLERYADARNDEKGMNRLGIDYQRELGKRHLTMVPLLCYFVRGIDWYG